MPTNHESSIDGPHVFHGPAATLEDAVKELLPTTGSVEVQRDSAGRHHPAHQHPTPETLLVVDGAIRFQWDGGEVHCRPGDRLLLPARVRHSSVAGARGCLYVIATRIQE